MSGFWPWYWGGFAVAAIAVAYPYCTGRLLGVSGLYARALAVISELFSPAPQPDEDAALLAALEAETQAEFGHPEPLAAPAPTGLDAVRRSPTRSAPLFLLGIIGGAALAALLRADAVDPLKLGQLFGERFATPTTAVLALAVSGVCIGFGTRLAGGCTSGHGITGVACGERGSLLATLVFWSVGVAVARLCVLRIGA
ncbi:MAG: YeeE/YedE family protein [Deltaproteobacteria bacterium]|nr:YeeE/YedE family protein [Deltaproteobacteria bacterium]